MDIISPQIQSVFQAGLTVLQTADAMEKADAARMLYRNWDKGNLRFEFVGDLPDRPARPNKPELLAPKDMPKRRKGGTIQNRVALLHAIAHIELNAIDLAVDIALRFGSEMPEDFTDGWLKVADDEARHFLLINERLKSFDSFYGALPAHDGLWQSALATADNLAARLAVVPMVLEARGLDVTPDMIDRLQAVGDIQSSNILKIIYEEEISHVALGKKWFSYLADLEKRNEETWFHTLVQEYFKGQLKRPFNRPARDEAGMPFTFYDPLADLL